MDDRANSLFAEQETTILPTISYLAHMLHTLCDAA